MAETTIFWFCWQVVSIYSMGVLWWFLPAFFCCYSLYVLAHLKLLSSSSPVLMDFPLGEKQFFFKFSSSLLSWWDITSLLSNFSVQLLVELCIFFVLFLGFDWHYFGSRRMALRDLIKIMWVERDGFGDTWHLIRKQMLAVYGEALSASCTQLVHMVQVGNTSFNHKGL